MELSRNQEGHSKAKQEAYTKDLLLRNLGPEQEKWHGRKVPVAKEDESELENKQEAERTPGEIREAQRVVGERIWLVTRCRPNIMYSAALMSTLTAAKPLKVTRMAYQVGLFGRIDERRIGLSWRRRRSDGLHGCFVWRRGCTRLCGGEVGGGSFSLEEFATKGCSPHQQPKLNSLTTEALGDG